MPSVVIFTKSISIRGGKEKVVAALANFLVSKKFTVEIVCYDNQTDPAFELDPAVRIRPVYLKLPDTSLSLSSRLPHLLSDVKLCRQLCNGKTGSAIVATDYLAVFLLLFTSISFKKQLVVWEHLTHHLLQSSFWKAVRKYTYSRSRVVVALNAEEANFYKGLGCYSITIPNSVQPAAQSASRSRQTILWAGTLSADKGLNAVISAARLLKQENVPAVIKIYGKGALQDDLVSTISKEGLQDVLRYEGVFTSADHVYEDVSVVWVTSLHESFSMVILEGFSHGIPAVAFNCPTGPRNLIQNGVNGFIVQPGDVKSLVRKTNDLLSNEEVYVRMSNEAYATAKKYTPEVVNERWLQLLSA